MTLQVPETNSKPPENRCSEDEIPFGSLGLSVKVSGSVPGEITMVPKRACFRQFWEGVP